MPIAGTNFEASDGLNMVRINNCNRSNGCWFFVYDI